MKKTEYDMLVITGPTASGKTSLAAALADRLGGEVISADSRQVYGGMDLGTGKDYNDYIVNGRRIPYHLIDIAEPGYRYSVYEYQRDFTDVCASLKERGIFPIVCGGSGMYIDSILSSYRMLDVPVDTALRQELEAKGMEELAEILASLRKPHNITDLNDRERAMRAIEIEKYQASRNKETEPFPGINALVTGILVGREERRLRITRRLRERLDAGLIDEVEGLLDAGVEAETLIYYGLEYKYITLFLQGSLTRGEMFKSLETAIHQFAKRQMTWFRKMERKGIKIEWIDVSLPLEEKADTVLNLLFKS